MGFYERYEKICVLRGLQPCSRRAAELFNVTRATISAWKRNANAPKGETVALIAEKLGVSCDYLLGRAMPAQGRGSGGFITVNVYGAIPAGIPMEAIEDITGTEDISLDDIDADKEYFALRVRGDSMYPEYLDGDTVIFRRESVCESGDDCIVYVGSDEATLKRVRLFDDGSLEIRPINPNYAPRRFTPEEVRALPVSIGGVAIELRRFLGGN